MIMAHEFETGMFVREKAWHGLGTIVQEAPSSAEALRIAELDWNVVQKPVYTDGKEIPHFMANVRDKDNSVLGIVSDRYKIVQNREAFDFTDALIGDDVKYESCGSLRSGKTIWLLARMPKTTILGDAVEPYMCFTNSHDGTGAIKVCMTNVRVVCNNTLTIALDSAKRVWSAKHMGNIQSKFMAAKETLGLAQKYNEQLAVFAEEAANTTVSEEKKNEIIETLFPLENDYSDRRKNIVEKERQGFENCIIAVDLRPFYGTMWGMVNAVSDFCYHSTPNRTTSTLQENRMLTCINGLPMMQSVIEMCKTR